MSTATNTLHVADGLTLDADYLAGRSLAILGKRGTGKTHACRVLAEEFNSAQVQTVIIDPMGVFWGLRSSADGQREGLPIPVFGGEHGDAPLESSAGTLMADLAVDERLSMVLDLSLFTSRTQERTFAAAFFDRLYRRNKNLVHLIIDEVDLFAPQKPRGQDAPLLVTMENIVRRGRNKGIGATLASQRAAVVNKDILTQIDALAALRMTAPHDRDAVREWVRGQGDDEIWKQIGPSLPGLATGQAWWWIPEKNILERTQVRATQTFDSSPTRKRGKHTRAPKTFADIDMSSITDRISATVERARANDPKELAKQVRSLQRELTQARARTAAPATVEQVEIPVPVAPPGSREGLQEVREGLDELVAAAQALQARVGATESLLQDMPDLLSQRTAPATTTPPPTATEAPAQTPSPAQQSATDSSSEAAEPPIALTPDDQLAAVPPARANLLTALMDMENIGIGQPHRTQLALWAKVSPRSSGYANNLGGLRTLGLIDYPSSGLVNITEQGRHQVPAAPTAELPTDEALHEHVRSLLSPVKWRLVQPLIEAHPEPLHRTNLAEAAGVSSGSSGYANNLGALRTLGLIDYPSPGYVMASEALFLP